jgi:hypothetical protein
MPLLRLIRDVSPNVATLLHMLIREPRQDWQTGLNSRKIGENLLKVTARERQAAFRDPIEAIGQQPEKSG